MHVYTCTLVQKLYICICNSGLFEPILLFALPYIETFLLITFYISTFQETRAFETGFFFHIYNFYQDHYAFLTNVSTADGIFKFMEEMLETFNRSEAIMSFWVKLEVNFIS